MSTAVGTKVANWVATLEVVGKVEVGRVAVTALAGKEKEVAVGMALGRMVAVGRVAARVEVCSDQEDTSESLDKEEVEMAPEALAQAVGAEWVASKVGLQERAAAA